MSNLLPEITVLFHPKLQPTLRQQLEQLQTFAEVLLSWGSAYSTWFLGGATKDEALLHQVFDSGGVTTPAFAVLRTNNGGLEEADDIGIWNGEDGARSAGIGYTLGANNRPWTVSFRPRVDPTVTWQKVVAAMEVAIGIWTPVTVTATPPPYMNRRVFKDRPGVGWMLYLPGVLTVRQVPEARALVPVTGQDKKQLGTIVVSVTDEPFSDTNPAHVEIANAIEIRLADQDLLPRYVDL